MKKNAIYIMTGFVLGLLVAFVYRGLSLPEDGIRITYLQKFEIGDYSPDFVIVNGTYVDSSNDINLVSLECSLVSNICKETPVFITEEGITGIVRPKEYSIIEKTPTRIVARYDGLAAFHMFTIDLATKKVIFKNESNTNSSDVAIYELEDGNVSLNKIRDQE